MSNRLRAARILVTAAVLASFVKPVQDRVHATAPRSTIDPDLLFFSEPAALRRIALGYDGLLADLYWMRAIQYYGRRDEAARRPVRYGNLATLLDVATTLDPKMLEVYRFGAAFLSEPDPVGAGKPEEALRLLDKGIAHHPEDWRLPYEKGFVYFWHFQDYVKAGEVWLAAAGLRAAPPWMEGLAAMAMSQGGELETARLLWLRQYQESDRADLRENARNHLFSMKVDEDEWTLEFLVRRFRDRNGRAPRSLQELVQPGWLKRVPDDPSGVPYRYNPEDGTVRLSPETGVQRLWIPNHYRSVFERQLEKQFAGN